jgi:hypothetical protein
MKKWQLIAVAVCMAVLIAAPAMAFETVFKGYYEAWGVSHKTQNLSPDEPATSPSATNSWFEQKLDTNVIFKITDNTTLVTRFKAIQERWGTNEYDNFSASGDVDGSNFAWYEAFMVIKTKIGGFVIGRMPDGPWGTDYNDTTDPADRFNWVIPIDNWKFAFTYEKWNEFDSTGSPLESDPYNLSDADNDKYYLSAQYKDDQMKYGLLGTFYRVQTLVDLGTNFSKFTYDFTGGSAGPLGANGFQRPIEADVIVLTPYFVGSFGPIDLTFEGLYAWGDGSYPLKNNQTPLGIGTATVGDVYGSKDRDVKIFNYWVEGSFNTGPFSFSAGWAHRSGDVIGADDDGEVTSGGYIESGGDWEKMFILTDYWHSGLYNTLGGPALGDNGDGNYTMGNFAGSTAGSGRNLSQVAVNGYQMLYLGATYAPMENLTFEFLWATSKADEVVNHGVIDHAPSYGLPAGTPGFQQPAERWDDDHGMEYDLNCTWKIYDNLTWRSTLAYLDAGDYWKQGDSTKKLENLFSAFTMLTLSF